MIYNLNLKRCSEFDCDNRLNLRYLARERGWATFDGVNWLCPEHNPAWKPIRETNIVYSEKPNTVYTTPKSV